MTCENEDTRLADEFLHPRSRSLCKSGVSGSNSFINEQNFRFKGGSERKTEPCRHTGRVGFYRERKIIAKFTESFNFWNLAFDFAARHPKQKTCGHNCLVSGVL